MDNSIIIYIQPDSDSDSDSDDDIEQRLRNLELAYGSLLSAVEIINGTIQMILGRINHITTFFNNIVRNRRLFRRF